MTEMNKLYFKNLMLDLAHHKLITGLCIILCAGLCTLAGYKKVTDPEELTDYNARLEEYDEVLADVEKSFSVAEEQVKEMQEYIDESIYMKLDGQNIQVASVQYAISTEANVGNIFNAMIFYINEGGLRESLGDEHADLDVKYWKDVVACSTGGNVFNVTVMHYDAEKAKQILDIVKGRLLEQVPVISEVQGNFTLHEIRSSYYVKADVNVTNTQNNHRNTLKNYISNRADFLNKLISNQNGKSTYIENNMPVQLESDPSGAHMTVAFYLVIGIILGLAVPAGIFSLKNALKKTLRSDEDLKSFSLHTIGCCHTDSNRDDALKRGLVEIKYFVETSHLPFVFFNLLSEDEHVKKFVDGYQSLLNADNIQVKTGSRLQKDGEELKNMMEAKACVLVVQIGKTTYPQIEKQVELCGTLHIDILGCVIIA